MITNINNNSIEMRTFRICKFKTFMWMGMINAKGKHKLDDAIENENALNVCVSRGKVTGFSDKSRGRLLRYLSTCNAVYSGLLTVTTPFDHENMEIWKKLQDGFLRWLIKNIELNKGEKESSVLWVLEFTKAGRPHLHILLNGFISKERVAYAWSNQLVSGMANSEELVDLSPGKLADYYREVEKAGTRIESIKSGKGIVGYLAKYLSKGDGHGCENAMDNENVNATARARAHARTHAGRRWGVRGFDECLPAIRYDIEIAGIYHDNKPSYGHALWCFMTRQVINNPVRVVEWSEGVGVHVYWKGSDAEFAMWFDDLIEELERKYEMFEGMGFGRVYD